MLEVNLAFYSSYFCGDSSFWLLAGVLDCFVSLLFLLFSLEAFPCRVSSHSEEIWISRLSIYFFRESDVSNG